MGATELMSGWGCFSGVLSQNMGSMQKPRDPIHHYHSLKASCSVAKCAKKNMMFPEDVSWIFFLVLEIRTEPWIRFRETASVEVTDSFRTAIDPYTTTTRGNGVEVLVRKGLWWKEFRVQVLDVVGQPTSYDEWCLDVPCSSHGLWSKSGPRSELE